MERSSTSKNARQLTAKWISLLSVIALLSFSSALSMGLFSCNVRACRANSKTANVCGEYVCDPDSQLCHSKCTSDDQCDKSIGYKCNAGVCECPSDNTKAYCHRQCFNSPECLKLGYCKDSKGKNLCECKDPCTETGQFKELCLDKVNGATPESKPKQCIAIPTAGSEAPPADAGGTFDTGETTDTGTTDTETTDTGTTDQTP